MKLTKKMKQAKTNAFKNCRTYQQTSKIKHLINYHSLNMVFLNETNTLLELVSQIDQITNGQEYEVGWYTLSDDYLQIHIEYNHLDFYIYCKEILNTLENFLHVDCKLEEKITITKASTETRKSIICTKEI